MAFALPRGCGGTRFPVVTPAVGSPAMCCFCRTAKVDPWATPSTRSLWGPYPTQHFSQDESAHLEKNSRDLRQSLRVHSCQGGVAVRKSALADWSRFRHCTCQCCQATFNM